MRGTVAFCSLILFILASAGSVSGRGQEGPAKVGQAKVDSCTFDIVGLWRTRANTQTNPILYNFLPNGWVMLVQYSSNALPQDYQAVSEVKYSVRPESYGRNKSVESMRLTFFADFPDEVFAKGATSMVIFQYGKEVFSTVDPESGEQLNWLREQATRHFLTMAAGSGREHAEGPAFVMWTTLDGRNPKTEALGVQLIKDKSGKPLPLFGEVPAELYNQIQDAIERDKKAGKERNAIIRVELTEAEFERTHKVFDAWDKSVRTFTLRPQDPYMNVLDLLKQVIQSVNQCGERLKLSAQGRETIAAKQGLPQLLLEFVRVIRKENDDKHVSDPAFPFGWRPVVQLPPS